MKRMHGHVGLLGNSMANFLTPDELAEMGFDTSRLQNFDPTGQIVDEVNPNRGLYTSPGVSKDAIFTVNVYNYDTVRTLYVEMFNSMRSIAKIPNPAWYGQNDSGTQFAPFSAAKILNLIAAVGNQANYAAVAGINVPAIAIFNDFTGSLSYCGIHQMSDWAAHPIDNTPQGGQEVNLTVSCNQVPYQSLLDDINTGLVLDIRKIKIRTSDVDQFNEEIALNRYKSFGGADSNTVEYAIAEEPENQQANLINLVVEIFIDKATGLFVKIIPNAKVNYTFYCKAYRNNGVLFPA